MKKCLLIRFWTWLSVISITFGSLFIYFAWMVIADNLIILEMSHILRTLLTSGYFYLVILFNVGTLFLWEYFVRMLSMEFKPNYDQIGKLL